MRRPSWLVQKAAVVSFSMYITNEVFRIVYFGFANKLEARFPIPDWAQWTVWGGAVLGALIFAVVFHYLVDMPTQAALQPFFGRWTSRPRARPGTVAVAAAP